MRGALASWQLVHGARHRSQWQVDRALMQPLIIKLPHRTPTNATVSQRRLVCVAMVCAHPPARNVRCSTCLSARSRPHTTSDSDLSSPNTKVQCIVTGPV